MKLDELKARGGLVDTVLERKEVTWMRKDAQGDVEEIKFDIFVKRNSFGIIDQIMQSQRDDRSRSATLIAAGVRLGENGEEELTYQDAYALEPALATAMLSAFLEVNKLGKEPAKN